MPGSVHATTDGSPKWLSSTSTHLTSAGDISCELPAQKEFCVDPVSEATYRVVLIYVQFVNCWWCGNCPDIYLFIYYWDRT